MDGELTSSGLSTSIKSNDGSADDKKNDGYVFREREVDAKKNPTKLFRLIMLRQFKTATERLQYNADEASIWIYVRNKKKHSRKKYTARQLPIHIACLLLKPNMPNLFKLIKKLIEVYPDGVKKPDNGGKLPIHIAVWKAAPLPIVVKMLRLYPTSLEQQSDEKKKPLEYNPNLKIKNQDDMVNQLNERIRSKKEKVHEEAPVFRKARRSMSLGFATRSVPRARLSKFISVSRLGTESPETNPLTNVEELQAKIEETSKKLVAEKWKNIALIKKMSHITEYHHTRGDAWDENEKLKAELKNINSVYRRRSLENSGLVKNTDTDVGNEDNNEIHNNLTSNGHIDSSRQINLEDKCDKPEVTFEHHNGDSNTPNFSEFENTMYALNDDEKYDQIIYLDKKNKALARVISSLALQINALEIKMAKDTSSIVEPCQLMPWQSLPKKFVAQKGKQVEELKQLVSGELMINKPVHLYIPCAVNDEDFDAEDYWD